MITPQFIIGNEKRFFDFISGIDKKDKVAILSHGEDLDGILTAKIINEVIDANEVMLLKYQELNADLISELKKKKINKITITDMEISDTNFIKELEKFANVLIIDHHIFRSEFNSEKTTFLNAQGFCNSYLCYYLFSKIQNLEKYDWLVACASFSDWLHEKNREWIKEIYKKYNIEYSDEIKKTKLWDIQAQLVLAIIYFQKDPNKVLKYLGKKYPDVGDLAKYGVEIKKEIEGLVKKFEKENEKIGDILFWEFKPKHAVTSSVATQISLNHWNETLIILNPADELFRISARRQDGQVDTASILKKLVQGLEKGSAGGHKPASGGFFHKKSYKEFMRRLRAHEF